MTTPRSNFITTQEPRSHKQMEGLLDRLYRVGWEQWDDMVVETSVMLRQALDEIYELRGFNSMSCTGISAAWCPIHGDCTCVRSEEDDRFDHVYAPVGLDDWNCPLHSMESSHS